MEINWKKISSEFPINRKKIWLNNCGVCPPPDFVSKRMKAYLDDYAQELFLSQNFNYAKAKANITSHLCKLIGCQPMEVTLLHNTAEGMNNIAQGLDFNKDDVILIVEDEYPSNVYPWARLYKQKGVLVKFVPIERDPESFLKGLEKTIDENKKKNIRLLSISGTHWITGMPFPLEKIGQLCAQHNIFFCVDGAQLVGMSPVDVKKMKIDFMAFSAWKWLMGPLGLGAFYISEKFYNAIEPTFIGTSSVVDELNHFPYRNKLKDGADKFSFSTPSLNDWIHFDASLEYLDNIGWPNIQTRIYKLAEILKEQLIDLGMTLPSERFADYNTGIISAKTPALLNTKIVEALEKENIYTSARKEYVRFSPHISNTEDQLAIAVGKLGEIIKS
ncbi:MAG: aminotransferase class V-fold PLP-dependent enzyme [Leptospirales bacterium]